MNTPAHLCLLAAIVVTAFRVDVMQRQLDNTEVNIYWDHEVVTTARWDTGREYPHCVELQYENPRQEKAVCYRLEISHENSTLP